MVLTRLTPVFLRRLTPLLVVLLNTGIFCVADEPENVYCDFVEGGKEIDGKCFCENLEYIFDANYLKCIPAAYGGILSECNEVYTCSYRMGQGAVCENGVCNCTENFHYMHGTCWPTRSYGESCKADAECLAYAESDAYACVEGVCACAEGASQMRPGSSSPLCKRNARVGEECESDLECPETSNCEKNSTNSLNYICSSTKMEINASHRIKVPEANVINLRGGPQRPKQALLAPEAADDSSCGTNEELTVFGNACVCKKGFFKPTGQSSCLPELGEPCRGAEDSHIQYGACRRSAKFSEDSSTADPSTPNGVWACEGGFVADPQNRVCEKTRRVTYNCRIDSQCAYYGGFCLEGHCACPDGQSYDSETLVCLEAKGLNEECTMDSDCRVNTEGSVECREGICQCKASYHPLGKDCRKDATAIGDECSETSDCVFASGDSAIVCASGLCDCDSGYFPLDDTSCQVGIDGRCQMSSDCSAVQFSECVEGSCACVEGYIRSGTSICLPVANNYGDDCEENSQCTGLTTDGENIMCSIDTSTCVCSSDYHYYNRRCWTVRILNQRCAYQSECTVENSHCKNNFCTCDFGYISDGDRTCKENSAPHVLAGSFATIAFIIFASRLV